MAFFRLLIGGVLLVVGRKLFWFFVGALGFILAFELATRLLRGPFWLALLVGAIAGVLGALLAVFLQGAAIWIAGFLAGGYLAFSLLNAFDLQSGWMGWLIFILGGAIGAGLLSAFFDWALIVLTAMSGTTLVIEALPVERPLSVLLAILLFFVGVVLQARGLRAEKADRG
ncbi:MAG: hypothetical protein PHS96_00790 [Anaerolineales bacterium]|nr:hypothetical protein [Anaerolineales bacterium]